MNLNTLNHEAYLHIHKISIFLYRIQIISYQTRMRNINSLWTRRH